MDYKAPFIWFGGKSKVAPLVWARFGDVANYVEPFFGSGAVLFGRPTAPGIETVNDKDGFVANFWRALKHAPEAVAEYADNPVNENDLHARHIWLVNQLADFVPRLEADPDFYDAKIAGWWVWGLCCWIGSGFCSGQGPWHVEHGKLVNMKSDGDAGKGVNRQRPHLGDAGTGVNRPKTGLAEYMQSLADRLRNVRVCCGDWQRICGPSPTHRLGMTGVFLDPPYSAEAGRENNLYRVEDDSVAHRCRAWAIEQGANPLMRIALCGYEGEHEMPADWECVAWKANGGYSWLGDGTNKNRHRERIWFSPACIRPELTLF
ncbi:MAG TPA: DNA adenine methylase [Candidatus Latescibacteria bacterium]|nr:DNA adenine methylase [Candidatus Latescibacterota bacterium]